jgi:quercetin dioxygenase-like cupin family protein
MVFQLQPIRREFDLEGFHSIYYFELNKHFFHTQETHDFWEMVYVDNGSITAIVDGIGLSLKQGQAIFHKPNEPHAHISNQIEPSNIMVVSFT